MMVYRFSSVMDSEFILEQVQITILHRRRRSYNMKPQVVTQGKDSLNARYTQGNLCLEFGAYADT
jgi:hypothetical protein